MLDVQSNCASVQTSLDSLQRHDLVARINRGRAYQDVLDQIQAFNSRLRNNGFDAVPFETQFERIGSRVTEFRSRYTHYDDLITSLRQVSCTNKPDDFISLLAQVRTDRVIVGGSVTAIEGALADYRQLIAELQVDLAPAKDTP